MAAEKIAEEAKDQTKEKHYPAKRGFWDNAAKVGFLILTSICTNYKCVGRENFPDTNPYVVVANHQCFADGMLVAKYLPRGQFKYMCALVGADLETDYGRLGKIIMRVGRGIPVARYGNPVRGLIMAKKEVEKGNICFVFPEGTRTHDGKLGEMKDGAAYMAIKANTPLVPVYISGAYQIWPRTEKWPHPFKGFLKRKKLVIYVGEPMYGKDYNNDPHELTAAFSKWMHSMEDKYIDPDNPKD